MIGTLGEAPESTVLVSTVEDVDRLEVKDPERVSYITQTTLSLDETKDIVARLKERFPKIQGPGGAGYLLRDGEPAAGGKSGGSDVPGAAGGGVAEQLQFATAGGSLREHGRTSVSH